MHIVRASRGNSKIISGTLVCEVRGNEGMGLLLRQWFSERLFFLLLLLWWAPTETAKHIHTVEEGSRRTIWPGLPKIWEVFNILR